MSPERQVDSIVSDRDVGMMAGALGKLGHAGNETDRLSEALKGEALVEALSSYPPAGEMFKR